MSGMAKCLKALDNTVLSDYHEGKLSFAFAAFGDASHRSGIFIVQTHQAFSFHGLALKKACAKPGGVIARMSALVSPCGGF